MDNKLDIKLFKFNYKTDYLPYYKQYTVKFNTDDTVYDLLETINKIEPFNFNKVQEFGVKINDLFVDTTTLVKEFVQKTSTELTIEPVSTYRVFYDLEIKNDDFFDKLKVFEPYISQEQKEQYAKTLQLYYYASNTLPFHKQYLGDHCMLIASDIVKSSPELEDEIFSIISNEQNGIWYHTSLKKRVFNVDETKEAKIENLLAKISKIEVISQGEYLENNTDIAQEFGDFNIAVYDQNDTGALKKIVENSKASFVNIPSQNDDLAIRSQQIDKNFSFKLAGNILLDAVDNNADFMLINDEECFNLFDQKQKEISKVLGRDIDLPIVTAKQFNSMLNGEKDQVKLGFNKHKVSIPFL